MSSRRKPVETLDPRINVPEQYMGVAANVRSRFNVYKHAADGRDLHTEIIDNIPLGGHETVVDVGCSDGATLLKMRVQLGHQGPLIGVDLDRSLFLPTELQMDRIGGLRPITFMQGEATHLDFVDDSVDALMALFMLYHVPNPEDALREFKRVVRPGGQIAIATSGRLNKFRHREFERSLAASLGVSPPPIFASPFNNDVAEQILPKHFEAIERNSQITEMIIGPDQVDDYLLSIQSMRTTFDPLPQSPQWGEAVNWLVRKPIEEEIAAQGFFWDAIERYYYICENPT